MAFNGEIKKKKKEKKVVERVGNERAAPAPHGSQRKFPSGPQFSDSILIPNKGHATPTSKHSIIRLPNTIFFFFFFHQSI